MLNTLTWVPFRLCLTATMCIVWKNNAHRRKVNANVYGVIFIKSRNWYVLILIFATVWDIYAKVILCLYNLLRSNIGPLIACCRPVNFLIRNDPCCDFILSHGYNYIHNWISTLFLWGSWWYDSNSSLVTFRNWYWRVERNDWCNV